MESKSYAKPYLCVGGPLDGQYAKSTDFAGVIGRDWSNEFKKYMSYDPPGIFHYLKHEYIQFNNGGGRSKTKHTMIWLHKSVLEGR